MSSRREKITNDAYPFTPNTDLTETEPQYNQNKAIILWGILSEEECILYGIQFLQVILSGDVPELTAEGKRVETGHGDSCTWRVVCL